MGIIINEKDYFHIFSNLVKKLENDRKKIIYTKIDKYIRRHENSNYEIILYRKWLCFWLECDKSLSVSKDILLNIKSYLIQNNDIRLHNDINQISRLRNLDLNIRNSDQFYWMMKAFSKIQHDKKEEFMRAVEIIQRVHIHTYIWICNNFHNNNFQNVYSLHLNNMGILPKKKSINRGKENFVRLILLVDNYHKIIN